MFGTYIFHLCHIDFSGIFHPQPLLLWAPHNIWSLSSLFPFLLSASFFLRSALIVPHLSLSGWSETEEPGVNFIRIFLLPQEGVGKVRRNAEFWAQASSGLVTSVLSENSVMVIRTGQEAYGGGIGGGRESWAQKSQPPQPFSTGSSIHTSRSQSMGKLSKGKRSLVQVNSKGRQSLV